MTQQEETAGGGPVDSLLLHDTEGPPEAKRVKTEDVKQKKKQKGGRSSAHTPKKPLVKQLSKAKAVKTGDLRSALIAGDTKSKQDAADVSTLPAASRKYWLIKSEPESRMQRGVDVKFSIQDLQDEPNQTTQWDGVRNYQARNFMRDEMRVGNLAFFYHSNCKVPGIAGIVEIVREGYVDDTQFDPKDPHFDAKSKPHDPKWFMVDVKFVRMLKRFVSLGELKRVHLEHRKSNGPLAEMVLFTHGRLSVQPVSKEAFEFILWLEKQTEH